MFKTTSHAHHPFMSAIAGDGQQVWTHVNLISALPWFFATYLQPSLDGPVLKTLLLSSVDQVADLLKDNEEESIEISELMLVSPSYLNHTEGWLMEPLTEIWHGRLNNDSDDYAFIYFLASGKRYVDSLESHDFLKISELKCLACLRR